MTRLKEEFRQLDRDGDGTLDFDEVCTLLRKGMSNLGHKEIRALFNAVDRNGNGRIDFEEFVDFVATTRPNPPGPATYTPNDMSESRHPSAPVATINNGPGHTLHGVNAESPGPCAYNTDEQPTLLRSRSSGSSIMGTGPGHEPVKMGRSSPGPCDYNTTNDLVQAHHPKQPCATIGNGPGHVALGAEHIPDRITGPTTYDAATAKSATISKSARATIGHGPGHVSLAMRSSSPGPGAYSADFTKQAGKPAAARATIGHGPGHRILDAHDSTPGPAAYLLQGRARIAGGAMARAPSQEVIQTMRNFRETDINHDGRLDFEEVRALLLRGNPNMREVDIKAIFAAVDKNVDHRIDFNELVDYLLPSGQPDNMTTRRKLKEAFAGLQPGPGTYNTAVRRDRIAGGGFGKAIRWT